MAFYFFTNNVYLCPMNLRCTIVIALLLLFVNGYTQTPANDTPLTLAQQMPEYPGGKDSLMYDILSKVVYPKACADSSIQGKVYIRFVVNRDGSASDFEVIKTPHPLLGDAAVQAARSIKKFSPGMQDGKPARVWVSVPVMFKIKKQELASYDCGENGPVYVGGTDQMGKDLVKLIVYPEYERKWNIQGKVLLNALINEQGLIETVEVVKGVSAGLDTEAIRVAKLLKPFIPSNVEGNAVKCYMSIPVVFGLLYTGYTIEIAGFRMTSVSQYFMNQQYTDINGYTLFDYYSEEGYDDFAKMLSDSMIYPEKALSLKAEGILKLRCTMSENLRLIPLESLNDPDNLFTAEAFRLIRLAHPFDEKIKTSNFFKDTLDAQVMFVLDKKHRWGKSFTRDEKEAEMLTDEGIVLFKKEKYEKAIEYFTAAIRYSSLHANAYYNRGVCELKLNNSQNACDDFRKAFLCGDLDAKYAIKQVCSQ